MTAEFIHAIKAEASPAQFPDGVSCQRLSHHSIKALAQALNIPERDVEIMALAENIIPERYVRNMRMLSIQDQQALLKAHVGVVGLGGLGGAVVEILARMGVGTLTLIDGDAFEDHNLNRQLLAVEKTLGSSKAESAARRVNAINSSITVHRHDLYLDEKNANDLLKACDAVVDCLDTIPVRFVLEKAAKRLHIPMVAAAVAGVSGHLTTIFPQDPGLKQIYGDPSANSAVGAEASLGCMPNAVMALASLECSEIMKIILKKGAPLRNQLLLVDLTDYTMECVDL